MRPLSARARRTRGRQNRSAPADRWRLCTRGRNRRIRSREESSELQNFAESAVKRGCGGPILVGIDTGGTFTDLVAIIGSEIRVHKVLSTPADPADGVIRGLRDMLADARPQPLTYTSTLPPNPLLQ